MIQDKIHFQFAKITIFANCVSKKYNNAVIIMFVHLQKLEHKWEANLIVLKYPPCWQM